MSGGIISSVNQGPRCRGDGGGCMCPQYFLELQRVSKKRYFVPPTQYQVTNGAPPPPSNLKVALRSLLIECFDHYIVSDQADSSILGNNKTNIMVSQGWVLPYIGYTGMCHWQGYGFQAIWSGIGSSNQRKLV